MLMERYGQDMSITLKKFSKVKIIISIIVFHFILFTIGTFYPNPYTKHLIKKDIEAYYTKWANDLGLQEPAFEYNNDIQFVAAVRKFVDWVNFETPRTERVPMEMIVAQAALESGWGTSRFAKEGNNLFGIRTWNKDNGLLPIGMSPDTPWRVRSFDTKCGSVKEYMSLLNYHEAYVDFRELRTKMLKNGEPLNGKKLIKTLKAFSTTKDYSARVINMMNKIEEVTVTEEFNQIDQEMVIKLKDKPPIPLKKPD